MDPYLVAMVRAAQTGAPCPPLWMTLLSGDLITGTPAKPDAFVEQSAGALTALYQPRGIRRRTPEQEPAARANGEVAPMGRVDPGAEDLTTMTLVDARVLWGGRGDGAELPAVRVSLDAVALWWLAGGKEIKGSSSFFVGVATSG